MVKILTAKYSNQTERTQIYINRSSQTVSSTVAGLSPYPTALRAIVAHVTQVYLCGCVDWIQLVQDRAEWRDLVETLMGLQRTNEDLGLI
jgi:hypothetical protein